MKKIFNVNFIRRIKTFDTLATKLLVLVLFSVLIPLIVISNLSIEIIMKPKIENAQGIVKNDNLKNIQRVVKNQVESILIVAIVSLFVAIFFAIYFSRKITVPILNLYKGAIELSKGNLNSRVDVRGKDEIARLGRAFNEMAYNLQSQQRMRDNFIAALTHDLKVPMLAENQTIDYMIQGAYGVVTEGQQEVLELIKSTNNSSLEMICTLLDVYKYDMGKFNLVKSDFDFIKLVSIAVKEVQSLATQKNIDIQIHTNKDEIIINADKSELKRVIYNVLSNAINNSYNNSKIECSVDEVINKEFYYPQNKHHENTTLQKSVKVRNSLIFRVDDHGVGIEDRDMSHLFKRFSLNKGRNPSGTGIGLYFSYQVIKNHKGLIWAESTKGEGSSFKFSIPLKAKKV